MFIVLFGIVAASLYFAMNEGNPLQQTLDRTVEYQMLLVLPVMLKIVFPIVVVRRGLEIAGSCREEHLEAAYDDPKSSRRLRRYAAGQLKNTAEARGADGWAQIWEERQRRA